MHKVNKVGGFKQGEQGPQLSVYMLCEANKVIGYEGKQAEV